ncbi:hypothetical protein F5Y14DRAFT_410853 [Nemania sp. NC0429]|nr:hypothetical protein F5Y14DRAFT_410853 [Nemania sp. NC0429]
MMAIRIPSASGHRSDPTSSCEAMFALLCGMQARDEYSRLLTKEEVVCCDCYRYRPKDKRFWQGMQKRFPAAKGADIKKSYGWSVAGWCKRSSSTYQCPDCWCVEHMRKYGLLDT